MIKLICSNSSFYTAVSKIPLIRNIFVFDLGCVDSINDHAVRSLIISKLRYGDSTGKETRAGRFSDVDQVVVSLINSGYCIHDVGCSSGVTSLELWEALESKSLRGRYTISDKFFLLRISGGFIRFVHDATGNLRQIYFGKILCDPMLSWPFFASKIFYRFFLHFAKCSKNVEELKEVVLLDAQVIRLLLDKSITIKSYDVFVGDSEKYSFVRCMNVLNPSYFSTAAIKIGVKVLKESLEENGMLLIGRTDGFGVNKASVYKNVADHLILVHDFNGGSELKDMLSFENI